MRRRDFIKVIAGSAAAWPLAVRGQTVSSIRSIGVLSTGGKDDPEATKGLAAFKLKLQELGWTAGKNFQIDIRFGNNNDERIRQASTELVAVSPEAALSTTSTATRALMDATSKIPIVAAVSGDPIALGFTKSLSRPTENVTGFTTFNDTLAAKRFEMLHEIVPTMHIAALMWVPVNPQQVLLETQTKEAARKFGIELLSLPIKEAKDISPALATAHDRHAAALIVAADPLTTNGRAIIDGCASLKLPAIHTFAFEARNGALMSYGIDIIENYRRSAEYMSRILKGAKIVDLPFQEPTRLTLAINLRTAKALGVTIPEDMLATADEVIE